MRRLYLILLISAVLIGGAESCSAQVEGDQPVLLERPAAMGAEKARNTEQRDTGVVLFLFAAFCALWAQNTGRSAWLWFFLGACFSVVAVLFLLTKNSNDNFEKKTFGRTSREPPST